MKIATVGGHPLCHIARDGVSAAIWALAALYLGLFLSWGLLCLHSPILAASSLEQPLCLCFLSPLPRHKHLNTWSQLALFEEVVES